MNRSAEMRGPVYWIVAMKATEPTMIPEAAEATSHSTICRSRLRQPPRARLIAAVITKARLICQRDSCNGPTRPEAASMNMAEAAKAAAAPSERTTASMMGVRSPARWLRPAPERSWRSARQC